MNKPSLGKTYEDVRKYNDVKSVTEEAELDKLSKMENFKRFKIYNENMSS